MFQSKFIKHREFSPSMQRCQWAKTDSMIKYHDEEWGVPVHDDQKLFEFLVLETAQAGLSWQTILNRREGYRKAFLNFDYRKIAQFTQKDQDRLLQDARIIRNKFKIASTITNAQYFLEVQEEFGSFDRYIWGFINNETIDGKRKQLSDIPANTEVSDALSKDLKRRGFKFVGSTICYAFMQAAGLVNDHEVQCFRYSALSTVL